MPHHQSSIRNYLPNVDQPVCDLPSSLHSLLLTTRSFQPVDISQIQNSRNISPLSDWIQQVPTSDFAKEMLSPRIKTFITSSFPQHFQYEPQFLVESVLHLAGFYDPMLGYEDCMGFIHQVAVGLLSL